MESSEPAPLEIRRVPPRQAWHALALAGAAVVGGGALIVAGVLAVATQDLAPAEQVNGVLVVVVGAMAAVWGGRRLRNRRGLLRTDLILRLDGRGVGALTGSLAEDGAWASLAWPDLDRVEIRTHHLGPPYFVDERHAPVLRFVATDDAAIQVGHGSPYEAVKAAALGITPAAAALAMILGPVTEQRLPPIRAWLAANQPGVPIDED